MRRILFAAPAICALHVVSGVGESLCDAEGQCKAVPEDLSVNASSSADDFLHGREQNGMTMEEFARRADHSWMKELRKDPESDRYVPNRQSREVKSGHYVPVRPLPLRRPRLVIHSPLMAAELGLSEEACHSDAFLRFFSGDMDAAPGFESWATPYALSIMGQPYTSNCPFKNGNGYGDGRAISIGEVIAPNGNRWEMQLKGSGPTPWCRGADGRAVLRSSVREFLASEAMHHLGIRTTRALSLIVSQAETVQRPWYSEGNDRGDGQPDIMGDEAIAITTRVSPSFTRIGHLDLFARRAAKPGATTQVREEHELMVRHAFNREYPDVLPHASLPERALAVFEVASQRIAAMVAGWLRVGFCQGNFNGDNCLISGRQVDYGPFGFIDQYDPLFAKWVGSGDHFAFMNQPDAAFANLMTFSTALEPLLDGAQTKLLRQKLETAKSTFRAEVNAMWCKKLGFKSDTGNCQPLFEAMEKLMRKSAVDYIIIFRELAAVISANRKSPEAAEDDELVKPLEHAFYKPLKTRYKKRWADWLRQWLLQLKTQGSLEDVVERMNLVNPKYILREYMMVNAYKAAQQGDFSLVHELYQLIQHPYDEQPELAVKYYQRAPSETLTRSGTSKFT